MPTRPYYKDVSKIRLMDSQIFSAPIMGLFDDLFSTQKQLHGRLEYRADMHTLFIDLKNYSIQTKEQITEMEELLSIEMSKLMTKAGGEKLHVIVNYDNFDCKANLTEYWAEMAKRLQALYYQSVKRFSGHVFMRYEAPGSR